MAQFPRPSKTDQGAGNLQSFEAEQPTQFANGSGRVVSGKPFLDAKQPGQRNENRSKSLHGKRQDDK